MADDVKTSDEIELEAIEKAISKRSAKPRLRRAAAPSDGNGGSNKTGLTSDTNSSITL